ncbi:hypothetical protein PanWU01x14_211430 [Parasponia andersonii]|uniref:Uncharacterized protein n=1 Tax=Parasponia andersonii TaxID=3476 RepID=A0A2P5BTN4_PARAD|nr:hypothetical protein PanWU01x14_211430 [Parasponia andersonii]
MAHQTGRTGPNRRDRNDENRLKYGFDAGFLSGVHAQSALNLDGGADSNVPPSCDSETDSSDGKSTRLTGLAASLRVLSDSLLRTERTEAELMKRREALRLQAEKRRVESEAELARMLLRTELQIASFVSRPSSVPSRKRKRIEEDETTPQVSQREGALLFTLLQCNLPF